jgi:NitT/TauT family transport system substrate-binding protein
LTKVTFAQPLPESVIFYPAIVGRELGFFEEEGIDLEIISGGDDIPLQAFVENGDADISSPGASEALFGAAKGADYEVIFDSWTKAAEGIVVPVDSDVQSLNDVEGKTLALATNEDRAFVAAALAAAGMDKDSVKTTVVGRTSGAVLARDLTNGKFAAYAGAVSDFAALQANGIELRPITPDELSRTPGGSMIASKQYMEENPELVEGFLRAYAKATYVGVADPELAAAVAKVAVPEEWREEDVGMALTKVVVDAHMPENEDRIGEVRKEVWEIAQQQLLDSGELSEPVDLDALLSNDWIDAANDWDRDEVLEQARQWVEQHGDGS